MTIDAQTLIQSLLLAAAAWGLLRFVRDVDSLSDSVRELQQQVKDCCTTPRRRATDRKRKP